MAGSTPQCVPILQVSQIALSLEFYVDRLGFELEWIYQPEGLPAFAAVRREQIRLFLTEHPESVFGSLIYCYVSPIASWYEAILSQGLQAEWPLERTEWGTQEFQIRDPDGNRLRFGERQVVEGS